MPLISPSVTTQINSDFANIADPETGIDITGKRDSTDELLQLNLDCTRQGRGIYFSKSQVLISSTFSPTCPIIGPIYPFKSSYPRASLISNIKDGSPTLQILDHDGFHIENLAIIAKQTVEEKANKIFPDTILFQIGEAGRTPSPEFASSRGYAHNIFVHGATIGASIQGWQNWVKLYAKRCGLGLETDEVNSCDLWLMLEDCEKPCAIKNLNASTINSLLIQGTVGNTPGTIDNCGQLTIANLYAEQLNRTTPFLKIGFETKVAALKFDSGVVNGRGIDGAPVQLDNVDGFHEDVKWNTGTDHTSYSTTRNTRDISNNSIRIASGFPHTKYDFPVENIYMEEGQSIGNIRCTTEIDLDVFMSGNNSLKISCLPVKKFNYLQVTEGNQGVLKLLAGEKFTLAAWVYVPNILAYADKGRTLFPGISLRSVHDNVIKQAWSSNTSYPKKDHWSFIHISGELTEEFDKLQYLFFANNSSNMAEGGECINVQKIVLAKGDVWEKLYREEYTDSSILIKM